MGKGLEISMIDPEKYPLFRPFVPTEDKIMLVAKKLMEEYLYLDDTARDYISIHRILNNLVNDRVNNIVYEFGDFDGILAFTGIIPGWRAAMVFKIWNPARWGADFVRQARSFISDLMDELELIRLESGSPDPRIVKMATMVGFKVEGMKTAGFKWNNRLFDDCIFAIIREERLNVQRGKENGPDELADAGTAGTPEENDSPGERESGAGGDSVSGGSHLGD